MHLSPNADMPHSRFAVHAGKLSFMHPHEFVINFVCCAINLFFFFLQNQWMSELAKLPALQKLCYNPCGETAIGPGLDMREIIIAKIPHLKILENSEISKVERNSAEIRFLNKFGIPPVASENRVDIER